jgi:hypothetical protein
VLSTSQEKDKALAESGLVECLQSRFVAETVRNVTTALQSGACALFFSRHVSMSYRDFRDEDMSHVRRFKEEDVFHVLSRF